MRHEAAARLGNAEGVHQMRVVVRRLRAILSALAPCLPPEPRRRASNELRWFADALAEARNLDVLVAEMLAPACAALPPASEFQRLTRSINERRRFARASVRATINSSRYRASVEALRRWFDECGWRADDDIAQLSRPIGELGPMMLERCYRRFKRRCKGFKKQSEEQRHELRIVLKKLRYACELFAGLYDQANGKRFIKQIKQLQDDLGYLNDVRVAENVIASTTGFGAPNVGIACAGRRVLAWHKRRIAADEPRLRRDIRLLLQAEPFWTEQVKSAAAPLSR